MNVPMSDLRPAEELVVRHRRKYLTYWRERENLYWFIRLVEEMIELGLLLVGLLQYSQKKGWHKESPQRELMGIASICINWLEMLSDDGEGLL